MERKDKLIIILMCGAPCTGKSTWVEQNTPILNKKYKAPVIVISRDIIRQSVYGNISHKQTKSKEDEVTKRYYKQLSRAMMVENAVIILDNTHLRESYIQSYLTTLKNQLFLEKAEFYIKATEAPYWKMRWRNFWRNIRTGKHIPKKALKDYFNRYQKIKVLLNTKYKEYLYHE